MGTFLEDRLTLNNENTPGFPSEPIRSTPTVALPLSRQAPSLVLRGTRVRSRCVARSCRLSTRFQRSSSQVFNQRHNTHTCHACMISQSIVKRTMIRLLDAVLSRKNPFFHSVQTDSRIQTLALPNRNNLSYFSRPGSSFRYHPPNTFRSGRPQPPKREHLGFPGNVEAQGLGVHVARRAWTVIPRPRNTPPTSTRSFVSRCHKSR